MNGEQIRRARKAAGLTQQELADAVGTSLRSVNNWENDRNSPRSSEAKLREVLGEHLSGGRTRPIAFSGALAASVSSEVDEDGEVTVTATVIGGPWDSSLEIRYWPGERGRLNPSDLLPIAAEAHTQAIARTKDLDNELEQEEGGEGNAGSTPSTSPPGSGPDQSHLRAVASGGKETPAEVAEADRLAAEERAEQLRNIEEMKRKKEKDGE